MAQGPHKAKARLGPPALCLLWFLIALFPSSAAARTSALPAVTPDASAELIYSKVLKGSLPEYVEIVVHADGSATYDGRQLAAPPRPRSLKLSQETTQQLFSLAAALHNFHSIKLESGKKVANLGLKTLTYEDGTQKYQTRFNFTTRREGQEITDLFERIGEVERRIIALEFATKYDPLGLPHELSLIQMELDNKALADPELMVPSLQEIARNSKFLHIAQVRAQNILQQIQSNN